MTTGEAGFVGFPPKVEVVKRLLLSDIPAVAREPFLAFLGDRVQYTRSGEPVFTEQAYNEWKKLF